MRTSKRTSSSGMSRSVVSAVPRSVVSAVPREAKAVEDARPTRTPDANR